MFDEVKFEELEVNQCFRFDPSFFADKYIVSENGMVRKLSDKLGEAIHFKVYPKNKVYLERLYAVHYDGLGYASGEAYGFTLWEDAPEELFTKPEVREFILDMQDKEGFDESKLTISRWHSKGDNDA